MNIITIYKDKKTSYLQIRQHQTQLFLYLQTIHLMVANWILKHNTRNKLILHLQEADHQLQGQVDIQIIY